MSQKCHNRTFRLHSGKMPSSKEESPGRCRPRAFHSSAFHGYHTRMSLGCTVSLRKAATIRCGKTHLSFLTARLGRASSSPLRIQSKRRPASNRGLVRRHATCNRGGHPKSNRRHRSGDSRLAGMPSSLQTTAADAEARALRHRSSEPRSPPCRVSARLLLEGDEDGRLEALTLPHPFHH
jgi:hypothetical protein